MENLGKFTLVIIAIVAAFLISLLSTHIVLSIANLYQLSFITALTFVQLYGVFILASIIGYSHKKSGEVDKKTFSELAWEAFSAAFAKVLFLLLSWGLAFVTFNILS